MSSIMRDVNIQIERCALNFSTSGCFLTIPESTKLSCNRFTYKNTTAKLDLRLEFPEQRRPLSLMNRLESKSTLNGSSTIIELAKQYDDKVALRINEPEDEAIILEDSDIVSMVMSLSNTSTGNTNNKRSESEVATESTPFNPLSNTNSKVQPLVRPGTDETVSETTDEQQDTVDISKEVEVLPKSHEQKLSQIQQELSTSTVNLIQGVSEGAAGVQEVGPSTRNESSDSILGEKVEQASSKLES